VNPADLRPETRAIIAAFESARPLVAARTGGDDVRLKGPDDLVTATDELVQQALEASLQAFDPSIVFVGEEGSLVAPSGPRHWLVDPICGTKNYASRLPLFSSNVALVEDGQLAVSGVMDGATGEILVGERGRGAWRVVGERLVAMHASTASNALALQVSKELTMRIIEATELDLRMLGSSLALTYAADGRVAGTIMRVTDARPGLHLAAAVLLAQEAGVTITNERGLPWQPSDAVVVAMADPQQHERLLRIVQSAGPS
jgi:myo-inositol-1(or 4)-monophosphatase